MDYKMISIDDIGLSNRSRNGLYRANIRTVEQLIALTEEDLYLIRNLGRKSVEEILDMIIKCKLGEIDIDSKDQGATDSSNRMLTVFDMVQIPRFHDQILRYVKSNDMEIEATALSFRPKKRLLDEGREYLSDIIFMSREDLMMLPTMGKKSVDEILTLIYDYLAQNESRIIATIDGNESELWDDRIIQARILRLFQDIGFKGLSFKEITKGVNLSEEVPEERLKKNIGILLAARELEYVDYRCYRVYRRFEDCLRLCPKINGRSRVFLEQRLNGYTLQEIADENDLTRERVRQVIKRDVKKVSAWYQGEFHLKQFDEDYYRYLYENYSFKKTDGSEWLGIVPYVWRYLDLIDVKQGKKSLQDAPDDEILDVGLRLKIRNYLNRNKVYVDGRWVEKKRADLEEAAVRKLCQEDVFFSDFTHMYNDFLKEEEIPYDTDLYYTQGVINTRKNRLMEQKFLLWKQNERMRYYDIDGQDYSELLEILNLEAYEDIDLSTLKFIEDYPDVMRKYDIRDQYELHNLLKKIISEDKCNDLKLHFGKMPILQFGTFDRDAAIFDLLVENAPIDQDGLADAIHAEYGFDQKTIIGSYLQPFRGYYHDGEYTVDQKPMTAKHINMLSVQLTDDFYYIDEIRKIYGNLVSDADLEEINPMNLYELGYTVLSRYAIRINLTLDSYFRGLLTSEEIVDIKPFRKRFTYVQSFSQVLTEMKRNLEVVEFEPNVLISYKRLEQSGITKEIMKKYCNSVNDYVKDNQYFTIQSLKSSGFESGLEEFGFSDWFYANLLLSDDRLSYGTVFCNLVFFKGNTEVTRKTFIEDRVREYSTVDRFDLIRDLEDNYGCRISESDVSNIPFILRDANLYYDRYLDRLYESRELYYKELDEAEGIV